MPVPHPTATPVSIIGLPYLFGLRGPSPRNAMALGPPALMANDRLRAGIAEQFSDAKYILIDDIDEPRIEQTAGVDSFNVIGLFQGDQLSRMQAQYARLAHEVRQARAGGRFPLAATGACCASLGMVAGLADSSDFGMIWFDAHEDARTPSNSKSGLMEGMPVAMIAGECWQAYCKEIPGFRPIPVDRILSIGLQDPSFTEDRQQGTLLKNIVTPTREPNSSFRQSLESALDALAARCSKVYVHVDVDVLDPAALVVSHYMAPFGLTVEDLHFSLAAIAARFEILALDYSGFDPTLDPDAVNILGESMAYTSSLIKDNLQSFARLANKR